MEPIRAAIADPERPATLDALLRALLMPHLGRDAARLVTQGPELALGPGGALASQVKQIGEADEGESAA